MSIGNIAHHRVVVYWVHQRAMILIGQGLKHFVFAKVTIQQPNGTTQQRQITFRRVVGVCESELPVRLSGSVFNLHHSSLACFVTIVTIVTIITVVTLVIIVSAVSVVGTGPNSSCAHTGHYCRPLAEFCG